MVDADGRLSLPIACTLGPTDGEQRMQEWRQLLATSRVGRERGDGYLAVRFRAGGDVGRRLERLVEAERECCSFVEWSITNHDDDVVLTISGDDEALSTFSF
jgi:hypothetical protein